ncbi:MAG TPA: hypothetical protein DCS97_09765 [Planctomycetes bacterium]|nr:hypothetical protein [Planctomycetota bacterium]
MSPPDQAQSPVAPPATSMTTKVLVSFGIFGLFFAFYVGAALLQTPVGKHLAMIPVAGMPLGLLMSLAIFPVSWLLIALWFWKAK